MRRTGAQELSDPGGWSISGLLWQVVRTTGWDVSRRGLMPTFHPAGKEPPSWGGGKGAVGLDDLWGPPMLENTEGISS